MGTGTILEHGFPPQPTPFIGRCADLSEIGSLLAAPTCRLLTLHGPGGIGKTRLAIAAATSSLDLFAQGAHFVALQSVPSTGALVSAIAAAIRLPLSGQIDPRAQLVHYLRDKHVLLVLDNFEHLVDDAELLGNLLAEAPALKLLVTSREALQLQEEWLYPVQGLPFPARGQAERLSDFGAVQLFVERAQRVRRDFSLAGEHEGVAQICQLVEGMPLALELAASWTKTLSCATIAKEIESSLSFLATNVRNVPERHRSTRAVFNSTWESLDAEERDAFKRLAVFRGGFGWEAAAVVAGASLPMLSALADKSLLQADPTGRYHLHELLRQHAEEHWETPQDASSIRGSHGRFYAEYLQRRLSAILGPGQREAVAEIEAELENVRQAWGWAIEHGETQALGKSFATLAQFFQMRSRYLEGAAALEQAAHRLLMNEATTPSDPALVGILAVLGWFYVRLGRFDQAQRVATEAEALYLQLGLPLLPGLGTDPRLQLGFVACARGDYGSAVRLAEQARQTAEAQNHRWNRQVAYDLLSRAVHYQGQLDLARQYAQTAYEATRETGDRWFMAYCLNQLGNVTAALGDNALAKARYEASFALREEIDDPEGMAVALNHLAGIARDQGNPNEAEQLYRRSLAIFQDIADPGGLVNSLAGLGGTLAGLGEYESAAEHLRSALELATAKRLVPHTFTALVGAGELLLRTGRSAQGLGVLAATIDHSASGRETQERARLLLRQNQPALPTEQLGIFLSAARQETIESIVAQTLAELLMVARTSNSGESESVPNFASRRTLLEPLSERELEVLRLVAAGLPNQQIADRLILSVGTVKSHLHHIAEKLGAANRTQAVHRARELGLL
jgi:predicted ATPase/DNA-binding CsgD family transcriptional regulator